MVDSAPPPSADGFLDPDQVATATFTATFRGWDQTQVATYLGRVAEALRGVAAERDDLAARALDAEARAVSAVDVDDATLTARLGDRTAAVLAAAHDSAAGIVADAVAREAEVVREAQDEARRLRDGAEAERRRGFEEGARDAEALVAEAERRRAQVDAEVGAARQAALAEVEETRYQILAAAEAEGRGLVAEARAAREMVLGDLARRRRVGRQQLEQLKAARERLLASLGVVKRAVEEATADLRVSLPEARFAAEAAGRRSESANEPTVDELEADIAALRMAGLPLGALDPDVRPVDDGAGDPDGPRLEEAAAGSDDNGPTGEDAVAPARAPIDAGATPEPTGQVLAPPVWPPVPPLGEAGGAETIRDRSVDGTPAEDGADEDEPDAGGAVEDEAVEDEAVEDEAVEDEAVEDERDEDERDEDEAVGDEQYGDEPDRDEPDRDEAVDDEAVDDEADGEAADETPPPVEVSLADAPDESTAGPTPVAQVAPVDDVASVPEPGRARTSNTLRGADVDALFARLRGGAPDTALEPDREQPPPPAPEPVTDARLDPVGPSTPVVPEPSATAGAVTARPIVSDSDSEVRVHLGGGPDRDALLARRDAALDPLVAALARRLKRTLADEQNELLDQLRRHEGGDLDAVVPDVDGRVEVWAETAAPVLVEAAAAGAALIDPEGVFRRVEEDLVGGGVLTGELVATIVAPLRARVLAAVEGAEGDVELAADGVRGRYREWRSLRVDEVARHLGHAAFARGAYDAARGSGTPLCWVADDGGVPCPDAEDNALAGPVMPGSAYPTGDLLPPAHPGCRCLLVAASEPPPRAEHQGSPR